MLRIILTYGTIAGLVAGAGLSAITVGLAGHDMLSNGMAVGYLTMLLALSTIFAAIKRRRDRDLGGVIRFWPAFGLGLGISAVAGILYVACWEATVAATHLDFANDYARFVVAQQRAKGLSGPALDRLVAEMDRFRVQYADPLYRLPMTFMEIFPVGVLVSLVSAGLLRNSRFLPAR